MPSPFTSSFASAAAGNTFSEATSNNRNNGSGDWSRARTNGATQTFRRPSGAASFSPREAGQSNTNPLPSGGAYVPPHLNSNYQTSTNRNGSFSESRISKDQLLDLFKANEKTGFASVNLDDLFVDGWTPGTQGDLSNGGWGKREEHKDTGGPDICWDYEGSVQPMAFLEMSEEEKEAFSTSVNSPLKPPTQNANKENTSNNGSTNRRTSVTQNATTSSPSNRPSTRRRESGGDLLQSGNPLSPSTNSRFAKDESTVASPPPSLLRRKTDLKDTFGPSLEDKDKEASRSGIDASSPFGSLKRTSTNPVSAGLNGPASPWSGAPPSAGLSPMGTFGAFALGSGSMQTPTSDKKPGFGSVRGESRFKGLMGTGGSEDGGHKVREKISANNPEKVTESTNEQQQRSRYNPSRDLYGEDDDIGSGSAALGGDDANLTVGQTPKHRNPDRQTSFDEIGFSSLNVSSDMHPFRDFMGRQNYSLHQTPQRNHEPMSPTTTNPYQSPEAEKAIPGDVDPDDSDLHNLQFSTTGQYSHASRGYQNPSDANAGDRSQTSSTGGIRGFPTLGGIGNLGLGSSGWSAAPGAIGTPSRAQPNYSGALGDSAYGTLSDLTSPSQSNAGFFGSGSLIGNAGSIGGRGDKLNSLLPNAMQDQTRGELPRPEQGFGDHRDPFLRDSSHNAPSFSLRETGRGGIDDHFGSAEGRNHGSQSLGSTFTTNDASQVASSQAPVSATAQTPFSAGPASGNFFGRTQDQDNLSSQMPATQQRQMVMPDRMRWIYRDPQGNMQGPFSGLEMHDWYKTGFFSPELQVKKREDADYEPLAQLIRRIGNSREPFLVPQIGIPHGSASTLPSASATTSGALPIATPSTAQPPFASSFPSFGTTLSAEQQNALERRKQEEQYLMARQKEHLAQQQVMLKQMQHMQGGQLHHHSSAHSLQSQPSYGSITSPLGYQPSPATGPIQPSAPLPGFFDGPRGNAGPLGAGSDHMSAVREEDLPGFMERLNMGRGNQFPTSYGQDSQHQQHVAAVLQERARQQREQEQFDMLMRGTEDPQSSERLEQYRQLRAQEDQQPYQQPAPIGGHVHGQPVEVDLSAQQQRRDTGVEYRDQPQPISSEQKQPEPLSLSEQVQKAAANQPPSAQPQPPWAKVDSGMPQPFPPPQSQSPMPAPTPQRNRQSVADALNAESQSQSPSQASVDTPSAALAPWAKEPAESLKGPSLKEIQAMEAQKAAQQEQINTAARRAVAEQERQNQQNQSSAPAPGLPSSSNWASSISPAIPNTAASAWAKPTSGKPAVATPIAGTKKTLAQIQKEEEARKHRQAAAQAAAAASNASTASVGPGGKRYADLASKTVPAPLQPSNAAWTTVGAGGKVKTPTATAPGLATRTVSAGIAQPSITNKSKPTISTSKAPGNQQHAQEEFQKWTKNTLSKGLNSDLSLDNFVTQLLLLPPEIEIISDSIYASSQTLDGRRFAEEFVRRRKLADRGQIPDSASASGFSSGTTNGSEAKSGGGWSEVAKKGPVAAKEEPAAGFKVVGGKKKGGKR